jgi:hypothetical protein
MYQLRQPFHTVAVSRRCTQRLKRPKRPGSTSSAVAPACCIARRQRITWAIWLSSM